MDLSTYVGLLTFLNEFMKDGELINLTIGTDALVMLYRPPEDMNDPLPPEIEYHNVHYKKKLSTSLKVKTVDGYESTGIYGTVYIYDPPATPIPSKHKYSINVAHATYASHELVRNAKAYIEEKNAQEEKKS